MNVSSETSTETTFFNDNGVSVTHSKVHAGGKTYSLTGSAFSRTRSTEHHEVHREETSRRRSRVLQWGTLAGLVIATSAGLYYGEAVREYFYVTSDRTMDEWPARGIAFALTIGIYAIGLLGAVLCVQVNRPYRMHHVYLDTGAGEQKIATSRNEAWIANLSAALNKAIARLSVAATEQPVNN